jgi:hypothetical protein
MASFDDELAVKADTRGLAVISLKAGVAASAAAMIGVTLLQGAAFGSPRLDSSSYSEDYSYSEDGSTSRSDFRDEPSYQMTFPMSFETRWPGFMNLIAGYQWMVSEESPEAPTAPAPEGTPADDQPETLPEPPESPDEMAPESPEEMTPESPEEAAPDSPGGSAPDSMSAEILSVHNRYRDEVGVPALTWSSQLASNAQGWADNLAARGGNVLEHSQGSGEGENLWLGTSGAFSYDQMVSAWGDEKQYFTGGNFPDVSSTGNWADVGHYTQMIWRDTTSVGCAVSTGGGNDVLVCRYAPAGNYIGQPVF